MRKLYNLILAVLLTGCVENTAHEHVSVHQVTDHNYEFIGHLYSSDYDNILLILEHNPNQQLNFYVTSDGGTSRHLLTVMDALYSHGKVNWYVVDHCDSACAILALSTKHATGKVNLHSFYAEHHHVIHIAPQFNHLILAKLETYGYDTLKLEPMFTTVKKMWPVVLEDGVIVDYGG